MAKARTKERTGKNAVVEINRDWCKGCGICISFCPGKALTQDELDKASWSHPENCIACSACELRCPDMAIEVKKEQGRPGSENP
jgi:2-oxoglutarate ferredoxin oxidoreductase subunit delta